MITDIKQREGANRGNIMFELRRCDWLRLALSADAILVLLRWGSLWL